MSSRKSERKSTELFSNLNPDTGYARTEIGNDGLTSEANLIYIIELIFFSSYRDLYIVFFVCSYTSVSTEQESSWKFMPFQSFKQFFVASLLHGALQGSMFQYSYA